MSRSPLDPFLIAAERARKEELAEMRLALRREVMPPQVTEQAELIDPDYAELVLEPDYSWSVKRR